MAQFLHILWNAHLLKDLRLNITNGVGLLNFEYKRLFLPSNEDLSNENLHNIFLKANRHGHRHRLRLFQILGSGVLCLVLGRKPRVRRVSK